MNQATKKTLIWTYVVIGVLPLAFQISVRSPVCAEAANCALSYAKAAVWSVIWPASWIAYLKGQI
jgi:hypothetical protein